jgi:predicted dehydrogenase
MKQKSQSRHTLPPQSSRREFLARGGKAAAASALAVAAVPHVHAAEDNTIRLALIGCGGRGRGAIGNAMSSAHGPVKLVAMADVVEDRLASTHKILSRQFSDRMDVPKDRQFVGFDAYKKAIECLGPGDVAMLTNYSGFRPTQFEYAVKKGVNVFMEKSFAPDAPGLRRLIRVAEEAEKKNLKVLAGLQCRHSVNRQELIRRFRDGAIGDILLIRGYRMHNVGMMGKKPPDYDELLWQIRNFTRFFWVSGGLYAEMDIHQIDEICWIKGEYPVTAHGIGGRIANSPDRSQNFDSMSIEWTFADGTKALFGMRWLGGHCHSEFATYAHGTKCAAQFSGQTHVGTARIYKDQRIADDNIVWEAPDEKFNPWDAEWNTLLDAIRNDKPQNNAKSAAYSNIADLMGRAATHSGEIITWKEMMNSNFQFCPNIDDMDYDTEPPLAPDADGFYPVPIPGVWNEV